MARPLTSGELAALIVYLTAPPPEDACTILGVDPDARAPDPWVERIFAMVNPPQTLRPIQLSREGLERQIQRGIFWSPPSVARPWRIWLTDLNQADAKLTVETAIPRAWWPRWWPPNFWLGQFVPHPRGTYAGCYVAWRKVEPWPSNAGAKPVTLDDLAVLVDAARARRAVRPPLTRRHWREFLPAWALEREGLAAAAGAPA